MQFSTLVILTFASAVFGTGTHPSVTKCETITKTIDPSNAYATCNVLACLEIKPVTQKCGCTTIPTTTVTQTACPTYCGSTSYITAVEDCFPSTSTTTTHKPPSSTTTTTKSSNPPSSSTTTSQHPPPSSTTTSKHPPPSSTTKSPSHPPPTTPPYTSSSRTIYTNTTKTFTETKTETTTTTLTTCPASVSCTGQTTTYTSTEVCPTTTCVCVLPSVTYTTTVLPQPTGDQQTTPATTPPAPSTSLSPTFREANMAGKWDASVGTGVLGAVLVAVAGLL